MPLRSYEDPHIFKVYVLDIGLLGALADLPFDVLYRGSRIFHEFHGAFIENYPLYAVLHCTRDIAS